MCHMQKEEQVLIPLMLAGGNPIIVHPIDMIRHEHDERGSPQTAEPQNRREIVKKQHCEAQHRLRS